MRILQIPSAALLVVLVVACTSQKEPAEAAVQALNASVSAARPDIEHYAADRLPAIDDAVGAVSRKLTAGDYAGVLADAPVVTTAVAEASRAAADRRTALTAEWGAFSGIPVMVQQATQKVAEITATRRLPKGMDMAALEAGQATISRATTLMAEASMAFEQDDLNVAVAKAKEIKAMIEPLMARLGLPAPAAGM